MTKQRQSHSRLDFSIFKAASDRLANIFSKALLGHCIISARVDVQKVGHDPVNGHGRRSHLTGEITSSSFRLTQWFGILIEQNYFI